LSGWKKHGTLLETPPSREAPKGPSPPAWLDDIVAAHPINFRYIIRNQVQGMADINVDGAV
jgi:hypothetical protein